ncbi:MAG: circadian clock protein KaiB [Chitinophagaceae bacterium]|nr:MAG: circadian clock protein KaiB [Chitinophagaceae bacterium]
MTDIPEILPHYTLKLFITGASPNSVRAVNNVRTICDQYLKNRYSLEVIDIYLQPELATLEQVIAVPLLIKYAPSPLKRLIGNMSDKAQVLKGLQINAEL